MTSVPGFMAIVAYGLYSSRHGFSVVDSVVAQLRHSTAQYGTVLYGTAGTAAQFQCILQLPAPQVQVFVSTHINVTTSLGCTTRTDTAVNPQTKGANTAPGP